MQLPARLAGFSFADPNRQGNAAIAKPEYSGADALRAPGLCLTLSDWSAELRILQNEERRRESIRRRERDGIAKTQALTE